MGVQLLLSKVDVGSIGAAIESMSKVRSTNLTLRLAVVVLHGWPHASVFTMNEEMGTCLA